MQTAVVWYNHGRTRRHYTVHIGYNSSSGHTFVAETMEGVFLHCATNKVYIRTETSEKNRIKRSRKMRKINKNVLSSSCLVKSHISPDVQILDGLKVEDAD